MKFDINGNDNLSVIALDKGSGVYAMATINHQVLVIKDLMEPTASERCMSAKALDRQPIQHFFVCLLCSFLLVNVYKN